MRAHASDAISTENRAERDDTNVDEGVEEDAKDDEETTRWHRRLLAAADTPCSERRWDEEEEEKESPSSVRRRCRRRVIGSSRREQVRSDISTRKMDEVGRRLPTAGRCMATARRRPLHTLANMVQCYARWGWCKLIKTKLRERARKLKTMSD